MIKRAIVRAFDNSRMFEPMKPGYYRVRFEFKGDDLAEEIFEITPGTHYADLEELCEGFCEGYSSLDDLRQISFELVYEPDPDVHRGVVIEQTKLDRMEQGNIYISPAHIQSLLAAAEKSVYGRLIPFS